MGCYFLSELPTEVCHCLGPKCGRGRNGPGHSFSQSNVSYDIQEQCQWGSADVIQSGLNRFDKGESKASTSRSASLVT
jgi:hypothetical protein